MEDKRARSSDESEPHYLYSKNRDFVKDAIVLFKNYNEFFISRIVSVISRKSGSDKLLKGSPS